MATQLRTVYDQVNESNKQLKADCAEIQKKIHQAEKRLLQEKEFKEKCAEMREKAAMLKKNTVASTEIMLSKQAMQEEKLQEMKQEQRNVESDLKKQQYAAHILAKQHRQLHDKAMLVSQKLKVCQDMLTAQREVQLEQQVERDHLAMDALKEVEDPELAIMRAAAAQLRLQQQIDARGDPNSFEGSDYRKANEMYQELKSELPTMYD